MSIAIIIPARGGSKGIPRKNLRPLHGKPLLYYSIALTKKLKPEVDAYVTSDDDEILMVAEKLGAKTLRRDTALAKDVTTLDPVIHDAFTRVSAQKKFDLVITLQPTSPLLKPETLERAIARILENKNIDTIISVENDTHLTWKEVGDKVVPNYERRINRQQLPKVYKETGGFLITRSEFVSENNRIGKNVEVFPLHRPESIDIDSFEDFQLCEYFLKRKNILIVTNGNNEIGLGHVYNTLSIANELVDQNISFLILKEGGLAREKIEQYNYPVIVQKKSNLVEEIRSINPELIINDLLDTEESYMKALKRAGYRVVNFEDLGTGAKYADLVFNAIYPEKKKLPNHYFGHPYFILRDEFYLTPVKKLKREVKNILITFGGVDTNNYTMKVLQAIYEYCEDSGIRINVVAGLGYSMYDTLLNFRNIYIHRNIKNISDFIVAADLIFTSAGRTTFEIAAIGVPSIVMAQNKRETTHLFASQKHGFKYLGLGTRLSKQEILKACVGLISNFEQRKKMHKAMLDYKIKEGKNRTVKLIKNLLHEMH